MADKRKRERGRRKTGEWGKFSEQRKIREKYKETYKFPGPKREAGRYNYDITLAYSRLHVLAGI